MRHVISCAIHTFVSKVFTSSTLHTHGVVEFLVLIYLNFEAMALLLLESVVDFSVRIHRGVLGRNGCMLRVVQTPMLITLMVF